MKTSNIVIFDTVEAGKVYGDMLVRKIYPDYSNHKKTIRVELQCTKCNKIRSTQIPLFRRGIGSKHGPCCFDERDYLGLQIGDMTVTDVIRDENNRVILRYECKVCGHVREKPYIQFLNGKAIHRHGQFCGDHREALKNKKLYAAFQNMKSRTNDSRCYEFARYGGRGIDSAVWNNYGTFKRDMDDEFREKFYQAIGNNTNISRKIVPSLERIDVDGPYCKENCTWIPNYKQQSNTSATVYFKAQHKDGRIVIDTNINDFCKRNKLCRAMVARCFLGILDDYYGWSIVKITKDEYLKLTKPSIPVDHYPFLIDELSRIYDFRKNRYPHIIQPDGSIKIPLCVLTNTSNYYIGVDAAQRLCVENNRSDITVMWDTKSKYPAFIVNKTDSKE